MDTPGERAARDGLRQSVSKNRMQVELAEETIAIIRHEMRQCVKEAMCEALSPANAEKFWLVGVKMLQREADQKTGSFVRRTAVAFVRKGLVFMFLGSLVYAWGGWAALAALLKALSTHHD